MIDLRERRRQLLNLTITEIILIMLFLVLLIAASLIKETTEQKKIIESYKSLDIDELQLIEFKKFNDAIKVLKKKMVSLQKWIYPK